MNFEAFGSSPEFTTPIQQFLFNNCSKIEEAKQSGEQSINNYMLFKQYSELMDKTLEKFLDYGNLDAETFMQAMQFAKSVKFSFGSLNLISVTPFSLHFRSFLLSLSNRNGKHRKTKISIYQKKHKRNYYHQLFDKR